MLRAALLFLLLAAPLASAEDAGSSQSLAPAAWCWSSGCDMGTAYGVGSAGRWHVGVVAGRETVGGAIGRLILERLWEDGAHLRVVLGVSWVARYDELAIDGGWAPAGMVAVSWRRER